MPRDADKQTHKQSRLGKGMLYVGWIIILGLFTMVFGDWQASRFNPNRNVVSTMSGETVEVILKRNHWGHYVANGLINGTTVTFLLDTGATHVSVPANIADKIGLHRGRKARSNTANGTVTVYMTNINHLQLGGLSMHDVRGTIMPNMKGNEILLGMSFLKHLELVQKGDTLILRN